MARRILPAVLAIAAAFADSHGSHGLAFDALLGAIPLAAVASLEGFGAYLDDRADALRGVQSLLWALALVLLVVSCAARSPATQMHTLPSAARSALVGALGIFLVKACLAAAPYLRRLAVAQVAKP